MNPMVGQQLVQIDDFVAVSEAKPQRDVFHLDVGIEASNFSYSVCTKQVRRGLRHEIHRPQVREDSTAVIRTGLGPPESVLAPPVLIDDPAVREASSGRRHRLQRPHLPLQLRWHPRVITTEEGEVFVSCVGEPHVQRGDQTLVFDLRQSNPWITKDVEMICDHLCRAIGRSIVDDEQLKMLERLSEHAVDRGSHVAPIIERGNHYADSGHRFQTLNPDPSCELAPSCGALDPSSPILWIHPSRWREADFDAVLQSRKGSTPFSCSLLAQRRQFLRELLVPL